MRSLVKPTSLGAALATIVASVAAAVAGALLMSGCASCASTIRETSMPLLATNALDGIATDQGGHKVFFADRTLQGIDVVDTSRPAPRFMGKIDVPAAPNGLAFAPDLKRVYAALDGGTVAVIDADPKSLRYMQVVDSVTVDTPPATAPSAASQSAPPAPQANLLDYSAANRRLYVSTGHSGMLAVVDATTNKVLKKFDVKAPDEQPRFDPADGRLYVTIPSSDSILQLDASSGKVLRTYTQTGCHPTGLAINPASQLAMVACRSSTALFNLRTGQDEISTTVPGGDLVSYDSSLDRFSVGATHGPKDSSVGVFSGDGQFMAQVPSSPNAHGVVFDDASGLAFAVGSVGFLAFSPSACAPPPRWLTFTGGAAFYFAPMVAFGLFLFFYARRRARGGPARPTLEDLQRDDLAAERERIRAIEDAIYGPLNS